MFRKTKNFNWYLTQIILVGIFMIPFISLVVSNEMFFPYITGKNFLFRVIVELLLGAWIILAYFDKNYRPKISLITVTLAVFIIVVGIADILGVNFDKSFWSNYERMEGYITILHLGAYFLVLSSVLNTQKAWDRLFHIMIIVSVLLGCFGIGEVLKSDFQIDRLASTLGNAIYLAVFMLVHMFLTAYLLFRDKVKNWNWRHYLYIVAILIQFINLYYTATRGTILGLIGGVLLTCLLLALFEEKNTIRKIATGILIGLVIFIGAFITFKDAEFIKTSPTLNRFATISLDSGTISTRFIIWKMAYQGFAERPVFGWGQDNFGAVFSKYYNPELYSAEPWFDRAHNVFFDWFISAGSIGLLSYLSIFIATLYLLWKKKKNEYFSFFSKTIFTGLIVAYFFHNIFVFDNLISYILFFLVISYIHFLDVEFRQQSIAKQVDYTLKNTYSKLFSKSQYKNNDLKQVLPVFVLLITLLLIYKVNYNPYMQNRALIDAMRTYPEEYQKNFDFFQKAIAYDSFGNNETRERLLFHTLSINQNSQIDPALKSKYQNFAVSEIQKQIKETPNDARSLLLAFSLFGSLGRLEEAKEVIELARTIAPHKQSILFSLGSYYFNTKQYEQALEIYREAYELAPSNNEALVWYALLALYADKEDLAKELLVPIYGTHLLPEPRFIDFYVRQKKFDIAEKLLLQAIQNTPNQSLFRFQLASVYLELNKQDMALEVLNQAGVDFPSLKQQVDFYVNKINNKEIKTLEN